MTARLTEAQLAELIARLAAPSASASTGERTAGVVADALRSLGATLTVMEERVRGT